MGFARIAMGIGFVASVACGGSTPPPTTLPGAGSDSAASSGEGARGADAGSATLDITVGVVLRVTPPEATVTIDDAQRGAASELARGLALEPGLHTLEVAHPGYKSYRAEFSVTDKVEEFIVQLEPVP